MAASIGEDSYKLTIVGLGIAIDKDVNQDTALAIVRVLMGAPGEIAPEYRAPPEGGSTMHDRRHRLSIREFLEDSGAKTIPAKIVAIGLYVRDYEDQSDFSREEVKGRFRAAAEPAPANFPRDFQRAIQAGWIAEDHKSAGRFYITRKGEQAVGQRFSEATPQGGRLRRRRRAGSSADPEGREKKGAPAEEPMAADVRAGKPRSKGRDIGKSFDSWIEEGFFDQKRTLADVQGRFREQAIILPLTSVPKYLLRAVRAGRLVRSKEDVNGKSVWVYRTSGR